MVKSFTQPTTASSATKDDKSCKHTVKIHGSTVNYWVFNPKAKKTIVMIHGFRGTHHGLLFVAKRLPNYRLIIPDLPGFGTSTPLNKTHDLAGYCEFLGKFTSAVTDKPPALLGHSFGTLVCAKYATDNPKSVDKLMLINPLSSSFQNSENKFTANLTIFYYWLGKKLPAWLSRKLMANKIIIRVIGEVLAKTKDRNLRRVIHNQHFRHFSTYHNRHTLYEVFQASISHSIGDWARHLITPTLLLVGDKDDIAPLAWHAPVQRKIKNAKLVVINNVGHLIHYEAPEQAASAIDSFLRD